MWCRLFLLLLAGAASAEHFQAWRTGTEYQYQVRGRTLTGLHDFSDQYTGVILRALLTVRPKSQDTLQAKISEAQYAQIHTKLADGWDSEVSDSTLNLKTFPISEKVFEITMKDGVVLDLIVDKDIPTWEVNVLKSIVSQLQVDTERANLVPYKQEQKWNRANSMYKTMEDSVGGKCEVLYNITAMPEFNVQSRPELVPKPELLGVDGVVIEILKTKNYCNCEQRMGYHFGNTESNNWEPCTDDNDKFMSRSSVSRIIITGDLKTFTIQSSVMTQNVILSPNLHENTKGMVSSRVNLTLINMGSVSSSPWLIPVHHESVGNLVYSYNSPFARTGENRRAGSLPSLRENSTEWRTSKNSDNNGQGYVDDTDDDSDSLSSSIENSYESTEEQSYWQPTPTLNEAPSTPLLPLFIGYRGKSIFSPGAVNPVITSKRLANEIGHDLENANSIPDEQTLEKFTILARVIRTMSTQQIAEVERQIYQTDISNNRRDKSQNVPHNTWIAFRDAVAQAGTGPALLTIKNWIKEKKIKGIEAASVVAVLSKTARIPTSEYMDAYFEMVTMPETTNEEYLNSTAIITFAELIRYSQVNQDSARNHYPVRSFGRLSPKQNLAIFRDYIPYMSKQLEQAIENNEFSKSHVFIHALGNIAHPRILTIFEPYLEGKISASTFQRLLMVFSMNKLASLRPTLARDVFHKIYRNTTAAPQLRCAAVAFLMSTNPPASMLQSMAEFTNYDHSKLVNAAVKSSIDSASKLDAPESQDLAIKARNVLHRLKNDSYDYENSDNYFRDNVISDYNLAYRMHSYMASDDINLAFYASLEEIYGNFKLPKYEIGEIIYSAGDLYTAWNKQFKVHNKKNPRNRESNRMRRPRNEFSPENIAKLLKIQSENNEKFEGAFWMNSMYINKFISGDQHSLQRIPEFLGKAIAALKEGQNFNTAKIGSYDLTLSFPMESGFPFLYTRKVPTMLKYSGNAKGENAPDSVWGSIDLSVVYSMQIQARLGFLTPFEHQHYMAGVNKNFYAHAPIRAEFTYEKSENRVTLKLQLIEQNEQYKLVHYSVVPFTSRHNILDMSPVMKDEENRKIINDSVSHRSSREKNLQYEMEFDSGGNHKNHWNWDLLARMIFTHAQEDPEYHKLEVYLDPDQSGEQAIILSGSFDTLRDDTTKYDESRSKASPKAIAPTIKSKKLNDPERRKDLLNEAAKGIAAADAFALDFGIEFPGKESSHLFMTMAYANSKVDAKSRGLAYWRLASPQSQSEFETCGGFESRSPRSSTFAADINYRDFDVDLRIGPNCENGYNIQIHGEQERTDQYKKALFAQPIMSECMEEVRRGAKSMPACQDASVKSCILDKTHMSIKFDPRIPGFQDEVSKYLTIFPIFVPGEKFYTMRRASNDSAIDDYVLELSMYLDPSNNTANFSCENTNQRLITQDLEIPFGAFIVNAHPDLSVSERLNMNLNAVDSRQRICAFDSDWASTFDRATYPIEFGECWHVAMTTYPKTSKDTRASEPIDDDMKVSVLVRDSGESIEDIKKDVHIVLGSNELKFTVNDSKIRVTLGRTTVDLSEKHSYRHKNDEDIEFELLQRPDGSVRLSSSKYEIDTFYDGKRVQIKASEKYRNGIRGLCGNYDGEADNDFTSPQDCILSKSDQFVGAYALTSIDCQGPALQNSKKSDDAVCNYKTIHPPDVPNE